MGRPDPIVRSTGVRGPVTAREAWALVDAAHRNDLLSITSGEDISATGRSSQWTFITGSRLIEVLEREPESTLSVVEILSTATPQQPLPPTFVDSAEAAAALAQAGVDWVSGPTNMALSTRRNQSGQAVWWVSMYGRDYEVPLE